MRRRAFDKALAEGVGIGEIGREMCVAVCPLFLFGEERHVVARIVGELVGVARIERFRCAENSFKRLRV